jgi:hypothetical protein
MSTIDDKKVIAELLKNNGCYPDDPQMAIIFSYENQEGVLTAAVYYPSRVLHHEIAEFMNSPFVTNPQILWTQREGISLRGKQWLEEFGDAQA